MKEQRKGFYTLTKPLRISLCCFLLSISLVVCAMNLGLISAQVLQQFALPLPPVRVVAATVQSIRFGVIGDFGSATTIEDAVADAEEMADSHEVAPDRASVTAVGMGGAQTSDSRQTNFLFLPITQCIRLKNKVQLYHKGAGRCLATIFRAGLTGRSCQRGRLSQKLCRPTR